MMPDYILRHWMPRGVHLPKLPKIQISIYAMLRKYPRMTLPKGDLRARDYQKALLRYCRHKANAENMEKQHKCDLLPYLHQKEMKQFYRETMDRIERGDPYVLWD